MEDYEFTVNGVYEGLWEFPVNGEKQWGQLNINEGSVVLRIFGNGGVPGINSGNISIIGKAYNNKKDEFHFQLMDLSISRVQCYGSDFFELIFNIGQVLISENDSIDLCSIDCCIIRTELLDKWVWKYIKDGYSHNSTMLINGSQILEYKQKTTYKCYENRDYKTSLYFGTKTEHPSVNGFHMINRCFLNIHFTNKTNIVEVYDISNCIICLLSLLLNVPVKPQYVKYRTSNNQFIFLQSRSNSSLKEDDTKLVFTNLTDFTNEEIVSIFDNWINLYKKYSDALVLFFDTKRNTDLSFDVRIKNYISVIDGITECAVTDGSSNDTRKKQELQSLLGRCNELTPDEKNKIKMWVLREKGTELRPRFRNLIFEVESLLPSEYIEKTYSVNSNEFVDKVLNTRNYLTHPKDSVENEIIYLNEYYKYVFGLHKILSVYLMNKIGVPEHLIKRISEF